MIRYIVPNKTIKPLKTNKISPNLKWNQTKSEALVIKSNILANFDSLAVLGFPLVIFYFIQILKYGTHFVSNGVIRN